VELPKLYDDLETEYAYTTFGPLYSPDSPPTPNIRGNLWKVICKIDDVKLSALTYYYNLRDAKIKDLNKQKKNKD